MNPEELATSVLAYALWPSLNLVVLVLWVAAALDILRHKRRGTFTDATLWGMGAVVSVIAVAAISSFYAVFAGQWSEAMSRANIGGILASKPPDESPNHAYVFSFGLENASYGPASDSAGKGRGEGRPSR
jgi:hypothetical protein